MSNTRVFKDEKLNDLLFRQGYVKINFLNHDEIQILQDFYLKTHEDKEEIFTTVISLDIQYKKKIDWEIKQIFQRAINEYFLGYKPFWGNFFSKKPGDSEMPLHSDLQYVNEPENISINIWCPLIDTDVSNGTLGIVPYSHLLMKQCRGTNITDAYRKNAKEIAHNYRRFLSFTAGEAIIYDHRLLHHSSSNNTNQSRIAATLTMVPENMPIFHYYAEKEGCSTIFKFLIDRPEDLIETEFLQKPKNLFPIEIIEEYKFSPLTIADFRHLNMKEAYD